MIYNLFDNRTGKETKFTTTVDVKIDGEDIVFDFDCINSDFYCANEGYNTNLYDGDVCEAFICVDGNRENYFELEVAPNNSVFFKRVHNPKDGKRTSYEMENTVKSSVTKNGRDYKVHLAVPLTSMGWDKKHKILFNAYRIETEGGETNKNLLAVNPTLSDTYHKPEFFIEL